MLDKSLLTASQSLTIKVQHLFMGCLFALMITGCACSDNRKPEVDKESKNKQVAALMGASETSQEKVTLAEAHLRPIKGNQVRGVVTFTKVPDGVKIVADIDGLTPGMHGFHIHEHGDCGGEEAANAGAHFNPTDSQHGSPESVNRHVGDLGNVVADKNGYAHYERVDRLISLEGKNSIVGRSIIVHADKDDYVTQPAGASGAKISCGVIQAVSNPLNLNSQKR